MIRTAAVAPSHLSARSAGALRGAALRPRQTAAAPRRPQPSRLARRGLTTRAAVLPIAIKVAADVVGAFVVLYCSLTYVNLRRVRLEVEEIQKDRSLKAAEHKAKLQKLTGQGPAGSEGDKEA